MRHMWFVVDNFHDHAVAGTVRHALASHTLDFVAVEPTYTTESLASGRLEPCDPDFDGDDQTLNKLFQATIQMAGRVARYEFYGKFPYRFMLVLHDSPAVVAQTLAAAREEWDSVLELEDSPSGRALARRCPILGWTAYREMMLVRSSF